MALTVNKINIFYDYFQELTQMKMLLYSEKMLSKVMSVLFRAVTQNGDQTEIHMETKAMTTTPHSQWTTTTGVISMPKLPC